MKLVAEVDPPGPLRDALDHRGRNVAEAAGPVKGHSRSIAAFQEKRPICQDGQNGIPLIVRIFRTVADNVALVVAVKLKDGLPSRRQIRHEHTLRESDIEHLRPPAPHRDDSIERPGRLFHRPSLDAIGV